MSDWLERPPPMRMRPIWMTTMVDLLALLVSFFVLMFATSQIRNESWRALSAGFQAALATGEAASIEVPEERPAPRVLKPQAADLDYLHRLLVGKIAGDPVLSRAEVRRGSDAIVLAIPGDLLFRPDSAEVSAEAQAAAAELAGALRFVANQIEVAGHSDPTPPSAQGPFASNWELSLARSLAFARALLASGYQLKVNAVGYGASRFDPGGDMAEARRVELIIRAAGGGDHAR
jgi:chemotaxis protein MotB